MNEDILISSNWSQANGSLSVITVDNIAEIDLDEMMTPESCVLLSPDHNDDRGHLEISGPLTSVTLITDNQRWEVLGNMQYLFSSSGKVIEEMDESKVYSVEMSLKSSNCGRYIFRLPPSVQSCWIYSVIVEKARIPLKASPATAHFDLENIKNLMSDTKGLSSNAETFKSLFDNFQSSSPFMVPPSLQTNSSSLTGNSTSDDKSHELTVMKFYIDKKLKDLEEKVLRRIEESERVQSKKLDKIISLIEMRNSSSS